MKFLIVGASGVPVNLGTVFLVTKALEHSVSTSTRDAVAYLSGIALSIFTNFLLNNFWTWGDRTQCAEAGFIKRLFKFYLVSSLACIVQYVTSVLVSHAMRDAQVFSTQISGEYRLYHILAPLLGIALGTIINFSLNHIWTFKAKK
jgi:dolichol-phosphate mannosyltransferase